MQSAEEGLLVSLDQRGIVDLPYIATLYAAPVRQIIAELGDLIYQDPDTQAWHTADVYLSGNVRAKLAAAERAGAAYARNAEALRLVQPEDVLPGDIDANLGAPWIPETDIQAFAADLFGVVIGHGVHRPPADRCGVERRDGPGGGAVGGRHHGLRHGPCQRRRAAGAGPQPEKPDHL